MTLGSPLCARRCMSDTPQAAAADPHYHMPVPNLGFLSSVNASPSLLSVALVRNLPYLTPLYSLLTYYSITKCDQGYNSIFLESLFLCRTPPSGWGKIPKPPSSLAPGHTPTLIPNREQAHPPLGSQQAREPVVYSQFPVPAGPH